MRRLVGSELIGNGGPDAEWAKILGRVQSARERADYDATTDVESERAADIVEQAGKFVARMGEFVNVQGFDLPRID